MTDRDGIFDEPSIARLKGMLDETKRYTKPRLVPPHIRKVCMILGIKWREQEKITVDVVERAWGKQVTSLGGASDSEAEGYLSTAKETLVKWLRENPDLGGGDPNQSSPVPRRPLPDAGSSSIALSPESDTET